MWRKWDPMTAASILSGDEGPRSRGIGPGQAHGATPRRPHPPWNEATSSERIPKSFFQQFYASRAVPLNFPPAPADAPCLGKGHGFASTLLVAGLRGPHSRLDSKGLSPPSPCGSAPTPVPGRRRHPEGSKSPTATLRGFPYSIPDIRERLPQSG